ncbi:Alpha/beta hydrolase family protein [Flaviramulus basaltis]|uniref:Alpha/beta hydrolase family protein n=1 Tax=Flaviramulus basaltis TaxID=369401 RepID=A0A1K2ICK9_9FLAO|nr:alpha/beta fold hydrolase [Flaviramulus basaltis]SFZ89451.1 Alpha/beta hydrolase family protein [Flaviramulus basaltis]
MRQYKFILLFVIATISFQSLFSQTNNKSVFVVVHGAWGGGWVFKKVDSLLTATGSVVYRPTLTGQGERVHLATLDVGLDTHIKDIVNTILYEDLHDVILVGHSYSGMVITGVADSIPKRIKKLVYIDAFVPNDNESVALIKEESIKNYKIVNGYLIPPWVPEEKSPPKHVPQALKTLTDKISLKNPERLNIPTTYILTVEKGADPKSDNFAPQAERANKNGWKVLQLEADHNVQWSAPEELVKMLKEIENQ